MTRNELKNWLELTDAQVDALLTRGLPAAAGSQFDPDTVATWLAENGLTEAAVDDEPPPGCVRTVRELAAALDRSRPTVAGWLAEGGAPGPDERGFYNVAAVRKWRNQRDRELRRPQTYRGASNFSDADLDELREIVTREINHESSTHYHSVCEAIVAVLKLGHVLPEDIDERRKLLIEAICPPFKPWITSDADLTAKVEQRMADVLEPWGLACK